MKPEDSKDMAKEIVDDRITKSLSLFVTKSSKYETGTKLVRDC